MMKKNMILRIGFLFLIASLASCHIRKPKAALNGYSSDVQTIVSNKCFSCHSGGTAEGDLGSIDDANTLISQGYIVPGSPSTSAFYQKITASPSFGARMPYGGPYLSDSEIATISTWISSMTSLGATACVPHIVAGTPSWTNDVKPLLDQNLSGNVGGKCVACHNQTGSTGTKWTLSTDYAGGVGNASYAQLFTSTACAVTTAGANAVPDKACVPFAGPMVVAGNPCGSRLYRRISQSTQPADFSETITGGWLMPRGITTTPPARRGLNEAELGIIYTWILNGAPNN